MKAFIQILSFLIACSAQAQIQDDFSDRDLCHNPNWQGDVDSFMVNSSLELQLKASGSGLAYLSTAANPVLNDMEWRFRIRLAFAPSANNYAVFYLSSDRKNPTDTNAETYYLQFGEKGSADAIRFYKQKNNNPQLLCSGKDSAIASAFDMGVKIIRSVAGEWQIFSCDVDNKIYHLACSCSDTSKINMQYLGLLCNYTSSNSENFIWDDIYYGEIIIDTIPPKLIACQCLTENTLLLTFNETLDSSQAFNCLNYTINQNIGHPDSIVSLSKDFSHIQLIYKKPFPINRKLYLSISNIDDIYANHMADTGVYFVAYRSNPFDIVINEIMAKPTPEIGLPDAEYLELKNRTPFEIDLSGWQIIFGKNIRTFDSIRIAPYEYIIVTSKKTAPLYAPYGKTATVSSTLLKDEGQQLQLVDNKGNIIHCLTYSNNWHKETKEKGGWSLEMIDYDNPCEEAANWTSSNDPSGGTPGRKNACYTTNPDSKKPRLDRVINLDSLRITVFFSEPMHPHILRNLNSFHIDRNITIDSILSINPDMKSLNLLLNKKLERNQVYTLSIVDTLYDCSGNLLPMESFVKFGYAQTPDSFDIVINEVLFNPKDNNDIDFVEIYNRSDKIIDLKHLTLSRLGNDNCFEKGKTISAAGFQLFPDDYALLSTQSTVIQTQYICKNEKNFIEMESLPLYANESGTVILLHKNQAIDRFDYSADMHYCLLQSEEGVSLERINPHRKTQDASNWHSAASIVGYATPCFQNSCYCNNIEHENAFSVYPEIFSPDQDGYNDILQISYRFKKAGYKASINIYNNAGRKVKTLINNMLLSTEGVVSWDGSSDEQLKAGVGIYIIVIDYFNLKGEVKREKLTTTLAIKY